MSRMESMPSTGPSNLGREYRNGFAVHCHTPGEGVTVWMNADGGVRLLHAEAFWGIFVLE